MNFFAGDRMFGGRVNGSLHASATNPGKKAAAPMFPPTPRKPRFLGQGGATLQDVVTRINKDVAQLSDYYSRNAALPLEYRVPGADYATVANNSDSVWKDYVVPASPAMPNWNAPVPDNVLSRVGQNEQMISDFGNKVTAAEAKYAAAVQSGQTTGPAPVSQATVSTPAGEGVSIGMVALGVIAVATIAGVLFLTPANPIEGNVSNLPQR